MTELKCKNCNSNDLEFKGGIWICRSCGSKYLPNMNEVPAPTEEDRLVDELCDICGEIEGTDEFDEAQQERRDSLFRKLDDVTGQVMSINRNNPYAMTAKMLIQIYEGLNDSGSAERFVSYIETAINNSDSEAKENIWETLEFHLLHYADKVCELNPALHDRVGELIVTFARYNVSR